MTTLADLEGTARELFMALYRAMEGNPEAQISMYTIGETIGLDRDASTAAAEDLMAQGIVEIRTLSGAIGLSHDGAGLMADEPGSDNGASPRLGTESPLNATQGEMVAQVLTVLKSELGESGLDYETLGEVIADIRTIEAQMTSPRPKTVIIRESLTSLRDVARAKRQTQWQQRLDDFLK